VTPTQVKAQAFWDKSSFRLERGETKYKWLLIADFTAEEPCTLTATFNCRERLNGAHLEHVPVEEGGPPGFSRQYQKGKHVFKLDGSNAIDLKQWPLEVFWKLNARKGKDVIPIVLSLEAKGVQLVTHFCLAFTKSSQGLDCAMLKQEAVVNGVQYPLTEVYGLSELGGKDHDNASEGKPCCICLTDPINTAVLPCQHMCLCEDCATQLRYGAAVRKERCPICRGEIQSIQVFGVKGKS
jgi:hypothetical protein